MTRFPKLAGLAEVAGLAGGVTRQRAAQLAAHPDFPEPVARLAMGPVWRESDVVKFLATPRKPGRRVREQLNAHDRSQDDRRRTLTEARDRENGD